MKKAVVSIILVRYRVVEELFNCLNSLKKAKDKTQFEIILVDNGGGQSIEKELQKNYKWVKYVKAPHNLGFGPGNNFGAKYASGKYLFFLNCDTILFTGAIDELVTFFESHKNAGIISPILLKEEGKPFPRQGGVTLTPIRAIVAMSFITKLFPNNPISKEFYKQMWHKTKATEVDVIPGTAVMIRRNLFDELDGWDEHFFIYFEEYDLCKRAKEKGYMIFIVPQAKIIHLWERSTSSEKSRFAEIFRESRFYYFKKHFGLGSAILVECFSRFNKKTLLFFLILIIILVFLLYFSTLRTSF